MKTAAKIFIWINMICTFYLIYPIIIGILALEKINKAKCTDELKTMGVLTLIFCSFIGGILMLLIKEKDLVEYDEEMLEVDNNLLHKKYFKSFLIVTIISCILILISLIFSITIITTYGGGEKVFPLGINIVLILINSIILIFNCLKKDSKVINIITYIFISISIIFLIAQIVFTMLTYYMWAAKAFYYSGHQVIQTKVAWQCWIIFVLTLFTIALNIASLVLKINSKKKKIKRRISSKEYILQSTMKSKTDLIEKELLEIKNIYDKKVINEEEYNKTRSLIIEKYYKK